MVDDSIVKASSAMALGTIFSRITGLIRNLMLASVLGTALLGDTYNVGNTMPNILYNLLIGGALTAVFVPQIVRSLRDSDGGAAFISKLYSRLFRGATAPVGGAALSLMATCSIAHQTLLLFTIFCLPKGHYVYVEKAACMRLLQKLIH